MRRLGEGALLAGAVVTRDVAPGTTVAGIPATGIHRAKASGARS